MAFAFGTTEESLAWGAISAPAEETDLVSQAIKKEKLVKSVPFLSLFLVKTNSRFPRVLEKSKRAKRVFVVRQLPH